MSFPVPRGPFRSPAGRSRARVGSRANLARRRARRVPSGIVPAVVLVIALHLSAAREASAAEAPVSAYSRSLATEPDFLEHPSLVFVHPGLAMLESRKLIVLNTLNGPGGSGGIWALGPARLFLLSPQENLSAFQGTGLNLPMSSSSGLRLGGAVPIGSLRLGASVSGEVWKASQSEEGLVLESETRYRYEYAVREVNWRAWTALAGIGAGRGRRRIDLTWETRWQKRDDVLVGARQTQSQTDTLVVSFEGDERPIPGAHLRVRHPLGPSADLVLLADWSGHQERRSGRLRGNLFGYDIDSSRVWTGNRDAWRIGMAATRQIEPIDQVVLSAAFRRDRRPAYEASTSGPVREYADAKQFGVAISAREELRSSLALLVGVRRTYLLTKSTRESGSVGTQSGRYEVRSTRSDSMSQEFDWGLDWTWRNLRLTGALSTTLTLEAPFYTLDVALSL